MPKTELQAIPMGPYAPSRPPDDTSGALLELTGLAMAEGGKGKRLIDGWERVSQTESLDPGTSTDRQIVRFNPLLIDTEGRCGIAVIDTSISGSEMVLAVAINKAGTTPTYSGSPEQLQTLLFGSNVPTKVRVVNLHGQTYIFAHSEPAWVFDGENVRLAGIRAPRLRPSLQTATTAIQSLNDCEGGSVSSWSSPDTSTPAADTVVFADGAGSIRVELNSDTDPFSGTSEFVRLAATALNAGSNRLRFWMRSSKFAAPGKYGVRFDPGSGQVNYTINQPLYAEQWTLIEIDHAFAGQSPALLWYAEPWSAATVPFEDYSTSIWIDQVDNITAEAGNCTGYYEAAFTWYDPENFFGRESDPSPYSAPFDAGTSGYRLEVSARGQLPEDTGNVTTERIYLRRPATTGLDFRMVASKDYSGTTTKINVTDDELLNGEKLLSISASPPHAYLAEVVNDRIFLAGGYETTTQGDVTAGSHHITNISTTYRLWEGMRVRVQGEKEWYGILEVGSASIRIGVCHDTISEGDECGYKGATDTGVDLEIAQDYSQMVYSAVSARRGGYSEGFPLQNRLSFGAHRSERIQAYKPLDDILFVATDANCYVVTFNKEELDDAEAALPVNAPDLIAGATGCLAPLSMTVIPGTDTRESRVMFLAPGPRLAIGSSSGVTVIPGTDDVKKFFSDAGHAATIASVGGWLDTSDEYVLYVSDKALRFHVPSGQFSGVDETMHTVVFAENFPGNVSGDSRHFVGTYNADLWKAYSTGMMGFLPFAQQSNGFTFPVTSATSTTADITGTLLTSGQGLVGCFLAHVPADGGTITIAEITANTASQVTVASWNQTPVAGDEIIIGPIQWALLPQHLDYRSGGRLTGIEIDMEYTSATKVLLETWKAANRDRLVDTTAAATSSALLTENDLRKISIPVGGSFSYRQAYRLSGVGRGEGYVAAKRGTFKIIGGVIQEAIRNTRGTS